MRLFWGHLNKVVSRDVFVAWPLNEELLNVPCLWNWKFPAVLALPCLRAKWAGIVILAENLPRYKRRNSPRFKLPSSEAHHDIGHRTGFWPSAMPWGEGAPHRWTQWAQVPSCVATLLRLMRSHDTLRIATQLWRWNRRDHSRADMSDVLIGWKRASDCSAYFILSPDVCLHNYP